MSEPLSRRQSPSIPLVLPHDIKREDELAPVDHPAKLEDIDDVKPPPETPSVKTEPSPPPPLKREKSGSSTPMPANGKPKRAAPQLIGGLPLMEEEARATFVELIENHYQYNTLGRSREALESMTCECVYEHGQFAVFLLSSSLEYVVTDCLLVMGMRSGAFSLLQVWMTQGMHVAKARIVSIDSRRWSVYQTIVAVGPTAGTNGGYIICLFATRLCRDDAHHDLPPQREQVPAKGVRQYRDRVDGKEGVWVTGWL